MSEEKESHRTKKVEKELRELIGGYLVRHFPSTIISVTQVRVNKDLRAAKAYLSAFGEELISDDKLKEIQHHALAVQKLITEKLRMRYCPKIKFVKDEGAAAANKVDELLVKIKS